MLAFLKAKVQPNQRIILVSELILSVIFGFFFQLVFGRIGWLFGGISSGLLVFLFHKYIYHSLAKANRSNRTIGQTLVGLAIGFSMSESDITQLASEFHIYIFLTVFAIASGILIAFFYSYKHRVNLLTTLLATMPGGVSIMAIVAAEYNKDVMFVTTMQLARLLSVVLLIPLWVNMTNTTQEIADIPTASLISFEHNSLLVLIALTAAAIGSYLAHYFRLPVAALFGSMMAGLLFGIIQGHYLHASQFVMPSLVIISGQILMGTTIGENISKQPPPNIRLLFGTFQFICLTLLFAVFSAVLIKTFTSWSWLTCILATAPGGASEMVIVSLIFDQDNVGSITTSHLVRLMSINALLPLWIFLFRSLDRYFPIDEQKA